MTLCALADAVLTAHTRRARAELHHVEANKPLLRELARIGNNINQIAHEAHLMRLHLLEHDARQALTALQAALRRL